MSNGIGEPSCEELRAMWRYHKRQSRRAELTNQIPSFEPIYWQLPPPPPPGTIKSFGGFKNFKLNGRSRSSYSHRHRATGPYGQINYFGPQQQQQQRQRLRPMEELIRMQPPKEEQQQRPLITQPVVHLSPPASTPNSSFQQLQQLILEERQRQKGFGGDGGAGENGEKNKGRDEGKSGSRSSGSSSSGKNGGNNYGTLVLSPPHGHDGRLANKPPEMMTPFEKLRFGHMTFQDVDDEQVGAAAVMNDDPRLGPELEEEQMQQQQQKRGLFYYPIRAARVREQRERQQAEMSRTTTSSPPSSASSSLVVKSSSRNPPSLPHSSIPSVFFWRRQFAPQDTPPSIRMVSHLHFLDKLISVRFCLAQICP